MQMTVSFGMDDHIQVDSHNYLTIVRHDEECLLILPKFQSCNAFRSGNRSIEVDKVQGKL